MATFSHLYGAVTVSDSINYFLKNNLGTNTPTWLSWIYGVSQPRTLNFYYPDQPLTFPSFSVTHHTSDPVLSSQGDRADGTWRGIMRQGMMEINCWTSEVIYTKDGTTDKNNQWMTQLQTMRDMVYLLFQQNRFIQMYNFTVPTAPVLLNAIIKIRDIKESTVLPDPNPAVKRIRILGTYRWTERFT